MIEIKGTRDGLLINIEENDWQTAQTKLLQHIDEQIEFFKGANLILSLGDHTLKAAELGLLRDQISERGLTLWAILSTSPITEQTAQTLGIATRIHNPISSHEYVFSASPSDSNILGEDAILIRRTLRSGNKIQYPGHVIVFGDVNPGAEIIAGGDVFIWGKLKGTVHAGASGNTNAVIGALELAPTQLRIADQVAIQPNDHKPKGAEIVRLQDGVVLASPWLS